MKRATFAAALFVVACTNESDPATWVKRLDDPKRRVEAVEKLERLGGDASAHDDVVLAPLANAYVTGGLDAKTRSELFAMLATIDDARVDTALQKALEACAADVKPAAEAVRVRGGHANDALFACFAKYTPSKSSREAGVALHDALLAVKDPSWTPKAIALLEPPIVPGDSLDERGVKRFSDPLDFWQKTAIELLGALGDARAAKPLVVVMTTKSKRALAPLAKLALQPIAREAEPVLAAALDGNGEANAIVIDALAFTGLTSARDAVLASIPKLDDGDRAAAAQSFPWFPTDPRLIDALEDVYAHLPPNGTARASLLLTAGDMFEPRLFAWALREAASGWKGEAMVGAKASAIQTAIKLMGPEEKPTVESAMDVLENKSGLSPIERHEIAGNMHVIFDWASKALDACAKDAGCYAKLLDEPIPPEANVHWKWIKAATMCGLYGSDETRASLVKKTAAAKNPGVRKAMALAIAHLAPHGDPVGAAALDAIVRAESLPGDDPLAAVAAMLRARMP